MLKNTNAAYDFSLFEPTEKEKLNKAPSSKLIKLSKEQLYKSRRKKYNHLSIISVILFSCITLTILFTIITSQIELTELTAKTEVAKKLLDEKQSIYTQLEMKVESKLSLNQVEAYSRDVLGMQPIQPYQIKYISMASGDKSEIKKDDPKSWFQVVSEAISDMLS